MQRNRYKYNKHAGALQEAMSVPSPSFDAPSNSYVEAHSTGVNMPALRMGAATTRALVPTQAAEQEADQGLDPQNHRGQYGVFFFTVEEGHKVLVVEKDGSMSVVEGPARIWNRGRRFVAMKHYIAHPGEFLVVRYRDGRQEHLAGPAHCWLDPRIHRSIEREEALQISAKEAVVVYAESESDRDVSRRLVHGPATFVPSPGEWLHTFSWHGSVGGLKIPNAMVFQKLWLMPDQMYHDVAEVRTADDAVLTIRLMIFFELVDIERMLAATHDPIGDFVNAATSDVVDFLGRRDFEQFKGQTNKLNELATYKQLSSRANQSGYRIEKVVYRGYGAPPALQQMHDQAIESRTRLQLERATEQQAQELEDFKLERRLERDIKERQKQSMEFDQRLAQDRRQEEARLAMDAARREAARELARLDTEQAEHLELTRTENYTAYLRSLSELDVDLTALLTQGRADQVIEVRGDKGAANHIHLSERLAAKS